MKKKQILLIAICTMAIVWLTSCAKKDAMPVKEAIPENDAENKTEQFMEYDTPEKEKHVNALFLDQYYENRTWAICEGDYILLDTNGNAVARLDDLVPAEWIDNGYTHATKNSGDYPYFTINIDGEVTSQYSSDDSGEKVIACGGGYTMTVEDISDFDRAEYHYKVYNADGTMNGEFTIDDNYEDWAHYIGNGVFGIGDGYYCAKGAKWIETVPYSYSEISSSFMDSKMVIGVTHADDDGKCGLLILTEEGSIYEVFPEGLSTWCKISPIANDYCVIFDKGNSRIVSFDTVTGKSYVLDDSYYERLSDNTKLNAPIDDRIVIQMEGADEKIYSAVFDTKFNLIADTQLGDFGGASDGRFVVSIEVLEDAVYDTNGNFLFSISDMGYDIYPNNQRSDRYSCGALLVKREGMGNDCCYIDTEGNILFNEITFNGTKLISAN